MKIKPLFSEISMGVEIADSAIRFVQLRKGFGGIEVANFGEKEIPVERIEYSSSRDKVVLETIKGLFGEKRVKPKNVTVCIPRSSTFFRTLTLPPVKDDVIVPMVNNIAERHLPIRPSQAVYDFDFCEPDRKGMREVILMGAKRDDAIEMINFLKKAGISVLSLEPSTISTFRLIDDVLQSEAGEVTHIFIGEENVHINLFERGRLLASREVRLGKTDIMKNTDESIMKLSREIVASSSSHDIIPGQETLSGKVFLTCPEEVIGMIRDTLNGALGTEVIASSSPGWLQGNHGLDIAKYGICLGLAAASLRRPIVSVNLLPQEMKERRRKDSITKIWILAGINLILIFLLLGSIYLQRGRELSALKEQVELLEPRVRAAERVKREYLDAIRIEESIGEIESERMNWLDLLNDISKILPEDAWLTRIELEKGKPVLLAGMTSSAAKLIPVLEESPMLEDVKFEAPTTTTTVDGKQVENFRITATILTAEEQSETDSTR
ncbi:MAG: PilN domain-containing protein [Candidatus Glassbacteria bacterium]